MIVAILLLLLVSFIYPLFWMIISALKTNTEIFTTSYELPKILQWKNFVKVWNIGVKDYFLNSIIMTVASCLLTTAISGFAAFALCRYRFRARHAILMFILGGLMLAPQVGLIPNYQIMQALHLFDTYTGMILLYTVFRIPFTTFFMWTYFSTLPLEVEEAACIDGCSNIRILFRIVFPMCKPMLWTSILLTARFVWNDFLLGVIFTKSDSLRTIPYGLYSLRSEVGVDWAVLMAGPYTDINSPHRPLLVYAKAICPWIDRRQCKGVIRYTPNETNCFERLLISQRYLAYAKSLSRPELLRTSFFGNSW